MGFCSFNFKRTVQQNQKVQLLFIRLRTEEGSTIKSNKVVSCIFLPLKVRIFDNIMRQQNLSRISFKRSLNYKQQKSRKIQKIYLHFMYFDQSILKSIVANQVQQFYNQSLQKQKKTIYTRIQIINKNSNGKLSKEELVQFKKTVKWNQFIQIYIEEEIKCNQILNKIFIYSDIESQIIQYIGKDRQQQQDFLIVAYSEWSNLMAQQKLERTFKLFDKDGNGTISKSELQEIFGGLALQRCEWGKFF